MPRAPRVTGAQVVRVLERKGWTVVRTTGHVQMKHPSRAEIVSVPNHPGETVAPGTLANILRAAGLTADELRNLL